MSITRRLPEEPHRALERLVRNDWRTQVSTGTAQGAQTAAAMLQALAEGAGSMVEALTTAGNSAEILDQILQRLDLIEQRLTNLEGVEESG